jgi:hypothetical protein
MRALRGLKHSHTHLRYSGSIACTNIRLSQLNQQARYYSQPRKPNAKCERLVTDSRVRGSTSQQLLQIYKDGDELQLDV